MSMMPMAITPTMILPQVPMDERVNASSIEAAVTALKATGLNNIFAAVLSIETYDAVLTEAVQQGVAGDGQQNWLFGICFLGILEGRDL
jgi:hypothetical protein